MPALPASVSKAWDERSGPVVLTTVDKDVNPNAIYAACVGKFSEDLIVVADNYFDKTRKNILSGSRGSLLFITNDHKSFQIKGSIEYHREGDVYQFMKGWNPEKHPGQAAAALRVEEVYEGAKKLL